MDVDTYFFALLRYIHLNPVKARVVIDPADYPWSGHCAYLGTHSLPWLTTDFGLSLFGTTLEAARLAYRSFLGQECFASEDRLLDEVHPQDSRILGADRFAASLPSAICKPRGIQTLRQLAETICAEHRVSLDPIRSASRQRSLTPIRLAIATRAVDERIATLSEVARFLGRETNSLSELLDRYRH